MTYEDWIVNNLDLYVQQTYKLELDRYKQLHPYKPTVLWCILYKLGMVVECCHRTQKICQYVNIT